MPKKRLSAIADRGCMGGSSERASCNKVGKRSRESMEGYEQDMGGNQEDIPSINTFGEHNVGVI